MKSPEDEVNEKLEDFTKNFVATYEKMLNDYIQRIEDNIKKPGTWANLCMGTVEVGKNASEFFEEGEKVSFGVAFDVLTKIIFEAGVRYNRKQVKKLLKHLILFKKEPGNVRKELVVAAYKIFCSFECQFVQLTSDDTWERAMMKLSEDAVGRALNYFKKHDDVKFSSDSVALGVISGNSKKSKQSFRPGRTVQHKKVKWNTAELFSTTGLINENKYYSKKDGSSNIIFGFRLPLKYDNLNEYQDLIDPPKTFYKYLLKKDDVNKQEELLNKINGEDASLDKIKELIVDKNDDLEEDIQNLESCIEDNFEELKCFIQNNQNHLLEYLNCLLQQTKKNSEKLDNIKQQNQEILTKQDRQEEKIDTIHNILTDIKNPAKKPLWFRIVDELPSFTGRKKQLEDIHEKLKQNMIVVICGLAGVGKSELALQYAHVYCNKDEHFAVRIDVSTYDTAQRDFREVHGILQLKDKDEDDQPKSIQEMVKDIYRSLGNVGLFILDNAENYQAIKEYLPFEEPKKPSILITSLNVSEKEWTARRLKIERMVLNNFTDDEATEFVKKCLKIKNGSDDEYIKELIKKLHNFPLALNQAVSCINDDIVEYEGSSVQKNLSSYLSDLIKNPTKYLNYEIEDYMKNIFETLDMIDDKIKSEDDVSEQAWHLLNIIAYFMPSLIPEELLINKFGQGDIGKFMKITKGLKKYAVLTLRGGMFSIHGLVQEAIRLQIKDQKKEVKYLRETLNLFDEQLTNEQNIKTLSPHIVSTWKYACEYSNLIKTYITDDEKKCNTFFDIICEGNSYHTADVIVKDILKNKPKKLKAIINTRNSNKETKLHIAALNGHEKMVEILIEGEAEVNANNLFKMKPIHYAIKAGNFNIVKMLLEKGAFIECKTGYKYTPLHLASRNGFPDIVRLLLEKGANANAEANHQETPLHFAAKAYQVECVEALLDKTRNEENKVNVNARTQYQMTALHYAAKGGNLDIVKLLMQNGADVNVENEDSFTPLHLAAINNYADIAWELLYLEKIDPNIQTNNGNTPLHIASERGSLSIVQALLVRGAKTDIKNNDGKTAEDLATDEICKNVFLRLRI